MTSWSACGRRTSSASNGDAADAYAKSVVLADLEEAGDEDVVRKLIADLDVEGVGEAEVRKALAEQGEIARRQIMEAM